MAPTMGLQITGIAYLATYALFLPLMYWLAQRRIGFQWSRSVVFLSGATFAICVGVDITVTLTKWGMLIGCVAAVAFSIYSLGRITHMSNLGGPVGRIGAKVRQLTERRETI